ncbi:MAG: S1 RNA-binding domain-containing protein [Candidatus Woesearchaeota archaeon]|nr:S1 RNA-binding domain-containing protein [Candidatus Woesearchaeota archaeon]
MLYKKTGMPEEDELLLCTVTNVQYNSVFCDMDEYPGKSGMIHISEVTAGRIRNIREYVQEGRKVVCKVLRIDKIKGHIDLSLRRVNERQRIEKNQALKQELKAENLLAYIAKEQKKEPKKFYEEVAPKILEQYEYLHQAFQAVVEEEFSLADVLDKKLASVIETLVKERIKPKQVSIEGVFSVSTYKENGVKAVSDALVAAQKATETGTISYLGAGQYKVVVTAEEYKQAEKRLKAAVDTVEKAFKKDATANVAFARTDE